MVYILYICLNEKENKSLILDPKILYPKILRP
jgi:hypothetical protein